MKDQTDRVQQRCTCHMLLYNALVLSKSSMHHSSVLYSTDCRLYIITELDWTNGLPLELEVQHYASILGHTDVIT